jgi:transcriptional regulator with XRE-family HTH domain
MLSAATKLPMTRPKQNDDYLHLLDELKLARQQANISQDELSAALGRPQSFVSKCERGERRLDVIELREWVLALGGDPIGFITKLEERIGRNAMPPADFSIKTARERRR